VNLYLINYNFHSLLGCWFYSYLSSRISNSKFGVAVAEIHTQATILNGNLLRRYISVSPVLALESIYQTINRRRKFSRGPSKDPILAKIK